MARSKKKGPTAGTPDPQKGKGIAPWPEAKKGCGLSRHTDFSQSSDNIEKIADCPIGPVGQNEFEPPTYYVLRYFHDKEPYFVFTEWALSNPIRTIAPSKQNQDDKKKYIWFHAEVITKAEYETYKAVCRLPDYTSDLALELFQKS